MIFLHREANALKSVYRLFDYGKTHAAGLAVGFVHWLATFYLETLFLEVARSANLFNYLLCKTLALAALLAFWDFVFTAITKKDSPQRKVALYAIPCLVILVIYLFCEHDFTLVSDELNIYNNAKQLKDYAQWFVCYTGYYWITGLMIWPTMMGPTILKILLQSIVCGYCIYRMHKLCKSPWAFLLYGLFFLPELLVNGITAHRMPTYGVLYLLFFVQLIFDYLEKAPLTPKKLALLSVTAAVLTRWRSEGIYMVIWGLILILLAYRVRGKKEIAKVLAVFYCLHALTFAPQYVGSLGQDSRYLNLRMQHLYTYSMVNMSRNGLDLRQHPEELELISAISPIEGIDHLNETLGETNYARAFLLTTSNPYVVKGYDKDELNAFCNAARSVIFKHPLIFLKTQLKGWMYTSDQLVIDLDHGGRAAVVSLFHALRRPVYPFILMGIFWLISIFKKHPLGFFLTSGVLGNWAIVVLLMPAAYVKYFYVIYLTGYFLLFFFVIRWLSGRKKGAPQP